MKVTIRNRIVNHHAYPVILDLYNKELKEKGKVNKRRFFNEVIVPKIPNYTEASFYAFCKKFETEVGLAAATVQDYAHTISVPVSDAAATELATTMMENKRAEAKGINAALNVGAKFYEQLWEKYNTDPSSLTSFEASCLKDVMFKAMKSQDSRIHAIGKVREDDREEQKLRKTFDASAYG